MKSLFLTEQGIREVVDKPLSADERAELLKRAQSRRTPPPEQKSAVHALCAHCFLRDAETNKKFCRRCLDLRARAEAARLDNIKLRRMFICFLIVGTLILLGGLYLASPVLDAPHPRILN